MTNEQQQPEGSEEEEEPEPTREPTREQGGAPRPSRLSRVRDRRRSILRRGKHRNPPQQPQQKNR